MTFQATYICDSCFKKEPAKALGAGCWGTPQGWIEHQDNKTSEWYEYCTDCSKVCECCNEPMWIHYIDNPIIGVGTTTLDYLYALHPWLENMVEQLKSELEKYKQIVTLNHYGHTTERDELRSIILSLEEKIKTLESGK